MKTIKCVFMMQGLLINCVGSPYLSGATTYAELNHPFTFICTVTVSSNPTDEVSFQTGKDEIAVLKQTASGCVLSNVPHPVRYSASCESGTADIFARSKNYTLTIKRISVNDITDWFCETKNPKNRSNSFKVKLKLVGVWTSWSTRIGPCQADCKRIVFVSRTCRQPSSSGDIVVVCTGHRKKNFKQMCPVEKCVIGKQEKNTPLHPTVKVMFAATIILILLMVVLACVYRCPRPGLHEQQLPLTDLENTRQPSTQDLLHVDDIPVLSPNEIYRKYSLVTPPAKRPRTRSHTREDHRVYTQLSHYRTKNKQNRVVKFTEDYDKYRRVSSATETLKIRSQEARF